MADGFAVCARYPRSNYQGKLNPFAIISPKNHSAVVAAKPIKTTNVLPMSDMGFSPKRSRISEEKRTTDDEL